ncbi:hypothetical protein [Paenibacillus harenae]|uniref:Endolytic transglycosylase MltG n=1 Tax=Paenibacillus harenae TaxID=306543 RepID=A0ABT9U0D9_PAEHA|nr:hypothetical protein [Paenibacillus harenae]MDQ0113105.1 hypothetical protein [Paenibacillus harenae]
MLKNRTFVIGLGVGIIIGALLLELMYIGEKSEDRLARLGEDPTSEQKLYTQEEVDALLAAQEDSAEISNEVNKSPEEDATDSPAKANVQPAAPTSTPKPAVPTAKPVSVKKVLRIEHGSNLTSTASLLEKSGIIDDKTAFVNQMKKDKKLVRAGYFLFHENMTIKEAITIVTSKPLSKAEADAFESS